MQLVKFMEKRSIKGSETQQYSKTYKKKTLKWGNLKMENIFYWTFPYTLSVI